MYWSRKIQKQSHSHYLCHLTNSLPEPSTKNFEGLGIKESFETQPDETSSQNEMPNYALVNENEERVEFVDIENECYVKVTAERLQVHARSEAELSIAMAAVEARCASALMYLAKTIEERG